MNIVKYSCGCIGFLPDGEGKAALLATCDGDNGPTVSRGMDGKDLEELSDTDKWFWQRKLVAAMEDVQLVERCANLTSLFARRFKQ